MLDEADQIVSALPAEHAGSCVIDRRGRLFNGAPGQIPAALAGHEIIFHAGRIRGVLPTISIR